MRQRRQTRWGWVPRLTIVLLVLGLVGGAVWYTLLRDKSPERLDALVQHAQDQFDQGNRDNALVVCDQVDAISSEVLGSYFLRYQIAKEQIKQAVAIGDTEERIRQYTKMRRALQHCYAIDRKDTETLLASCEMVLNNLDLVRAQEPRLAERVVYLNSVRYHAFAASLVSYSGLKELDAIAPLVAKKGEPVPEESDAVKGFRAIEKRARWAIAQLSMQMGITRTQLLQTRSSELSIEEREQYFIEALNEFRQASKAFENLGRIDAGNAIYQLEQLRGLFERRKLASYTPDESHDGELSQQALFQTAASVALKSSDVVAGAILAARLCRSYEDDRLAEELLLKGIALLDKKKLDVVRLRLELAHLYATQGVFTQAEQLVDQVEQSTNTESYRALISEHRAEIFELSRRPELTTPEGAVLSAEAYWLQAVTATPPEEQAAARERFGDYYRRQARMEKALEQYRRASKAAPTEASPARKAGDLARRLNRLDEAKQWYTTLLTIIPGDLYAETMISRIASASSGEVDLSIARLRQELKQDPTNTEKLHEIATAFYQAYERATLASERRAHIDEGSLYLARLNRLDTVGLGTNKASMLRFQYAYARQRYDEAVREGEKAMDLDLREADRFHLRLWLANAHRMALGRGGSLSRAQSLAEELVRASTGDNPKAHLILGMIYATRDGGYSTAALSQLKRALEHAKRAGSEVARVHLELAAAYASKELANPTAAREQYEAAVRVEPASMTHWNDFAAFEFSQVPVEEQKLSAALTILDRAVATNKTNTAAQAEAYMVKYSFLARAGLMNDAQKSLETAIDLAPNNLMFKQQLAIFFEQTGKTQLAEATSRAILELDPTNRVAKRQIYELILRNFSGKERDQQLSTFVSELLAEPDQRDDTENRYLQARLDERQGRLADAVKGYTLVVERRSADVDTVVKILALLARGADPDATPTAASIALLNAMIEQTGYGAAYDEYRLRLAELYFADQQYGKAAAVIEKMHRAKQRGARSSILLGRCYLIKDGNRVAAESQFEWVVNPDHKTKPALLAEALYHWASLLYDSEEYTTSLAHARKAHTLSPLRRDLFELIDRLYDAGHPATPERMTAWLDEQFKRSHSEYNHLLLNRRGKLHQAADRLDEAFRDFSRAAEIVSEGWIEPHINRSIILEKKGELGRAIRLLERAMKNNDTEWLGYKRLGELYLKDGKPDAAKARFERAHELNPDFPIPPQP